MILNLLQILKICVFKGKKYSTFTPVGYFFYLTWRAPYIYLGSDQYPIVIDSNIAQSNNLHNSRPEEDPCQFNENKAN